MSEGHGRGTTSIYNTNMWASASSTTPESRKGAGRD